MNVEHTFVLLLLFGKGGAINGSVLAFDAVEYDFTVFVSCGGWNNVEVCLEKRHWIKEDYFFSSFYI